MNTKASALTQIREATERLLSDCASVSESQWLFRPAPAVWSVADITEHVTKANRALGRVSENLGRSPHAGMSRLATFVRKGHHGGMTESQLPLSLRRRDDDEAIHDDIAPYVGTTVEQRSEILSALCRLAAEQIAARPDGARVLQHEERRSFESERLWLRLVAAAR